MVWHMVAGALGRFDIGSMFPDFLLLLLVLFLADTPYVLLPPKISCAIIVGERE